MTTSKPRHFWFHVDDARTAEDCANRSDKWKPFVELPPGSVVLTRQELHEAIDYFMGTTAVFRDQLLDDIFGPAGLTTEEKE